MIGIHHQYFPEAERIVNMRQKNYKSRIILLLAAITLGMTLLAGACGQNNNPSDAAKNTAIAAIVQTVDAAKTPISLVTPTTTEESSSKVINFSGYDWIAKSSSNMLGPGPNYFSNSPQNVWVDEKGQLHLKITYRDNKWYCAEIATTQPLGQGSYQFQILSGAASLGTYAVLGLFTWDASAPQLNHREIDIELSRWGDPRGFNAQYAVQPWNHRGNRIRFDIDPRADSSTYAFTWSPQSVQFLSYRGIAQSPNPTDIINQWSYAGPDTPPDGGATNARINLWLLGGHPPSNGQEIEVVFSSFQFIPLTPTK